MLRGEMGVLSLPLFAILQISLLTVGLSGSSCHLNYKPLLKDDDDAWPHVYLKVIAIFV